MHLDFRVEDFESTLERALAAGAKSEQVNGVPGYPLVAFAAIRSGTDSVASASANNKKPGSMVECKLQIAASRRFLHFRLPNISEHIIMGHDIKTIQEARALLLRVWRQAAPFFLSIELFLMVLVAFATVGGVFLAFLGSALCLLPFGFALAYLVTRSMLHMKRIVAWPFI